MREKMRLRKIEKRNKHKSESEKWKEKGERTLPTPEPAISGGSGFQLKLEIHTISVRSIRCVFCPICDTIHACQLRWKEGSEDVRHTKHRHHRKKHILQHYKSHTRMYTHKRMYTCAHNTRTHLDAPKGSICQEEEGIAFSPKVRRSH